MQTGQSTVKSVFDASRIFNVPIYQRAYSWDKATHLPYFFNDLINQQPDRVYFFGTLLFQVNGKRGEFDVIDIIDGQQRMTTMIIFMSVLIGRMIELHSSKVSERTYCTYIKDQDVYKLELSNDDTSFLHQDVLTVRAGTAGTINTESKRLMLEARNYFIDCISDKSLETLEKIFNTLTTAEVLLYVVKEISSATQIFELLNDRGKKLTDLESIKSFLMYNIGLVSSNPDQLIKNIQEHFAAIYRLIETHGLEDADVLRYHTIAFEKEYEQRPKKFVKDKVSRLINDGNISEAKIFIENFTHALRRSFELYHTIKNNTIHHVLLDRLFMIGKVAPFYPVMMHTLKEKPEQFSELLLALTRFTFKASLIGLRSSGESTLYADLKNGYSTLEKLQTLGAGHWWDVTRRVKDALVMDNYYDRISKNLIRYVLFRYENQLREARGYSLLSRDDYESDDSRKKLNLEHITAKRAKGMDFGQEFKERFLNNLGNLVIDSTASNSSKNNAHTANKMEAYQSAPLMSQNEIDLKHIDWYDKEAVKGFIKERELILRNFIISELIKEPGLFDGTTFPAVEAPLAEAE